jgi:MFS family permease
MPRRPRIENALLRVRDGRRLFAAQFIDHLGSGLALVALPWLILENGGSEALSGLVATMGLIPYVVFGLFAGVVGDRLPGKPLLLFSYLGQAVAAAIIPVWAISGPPPTGIVLASAFLVGLGRTLVDAATFGAVATIVTRENFVEGQAAISVAWSSGSIAGPFAGGALIAAFGGAGAIAVQAVAFFVGALVVATISRPLAAPAARAAENVLESVREGIRVILHVPMLRLLTSIQFVWFLCVVGTQSLLIAYYKEELEFGARVVGVTMGVAGVVGLLGGIAVGALARRFGGVRLIAFGIVGSGLGILALAFAHGIWMALPAAAILAFSIQIAITSLIGERQRHAPDHLQARVGLSGRSIAFTAMMVGGLAASGLASLVSLRSLYLGVGLAALLIASWAVPAIFRATATTTAEQPAG